MAEFTVTISELERAASAEKTHAEAFRTAANAVLTAANELTQTGGGWDDDASKVFAEKIQELKTWCDNMAAIVDTYSQALGTIGEKYNEADQQAATQFKR